MTTSTLIFKFDVSSTFWLYLRRIHEWFVRGKLLITHLDSAVWYTLFDTTNYTYRTNHIETTN
jgi:hypothetical protein